MLALGHRGFVRRFYDRDELFVREDRFGFWNRRPLEDHQSLERLKARIGAALVGTLKLHRELAGRESLPKRAHVFQVPPRVFIDNSASRFATVIEVNGRDRPGLLYDLARSLKDLGVVIVSAHISTYGERVVDVFYVKDVFGLKINQGQKLRQIQRRLAAALGAAPAETPMTRKAAQGGG